MVSKKQTKEFVEGLTITKERREEIRQFIENYEFYISGKKNLNGGFARVTLTNIEEHDTYYKAYYNITLGDYFDEDKPRTQTYTGCNMFLDKTILRVLTDKECKARGIDTDG